MGAQTSAGPERGTPAWRRWVLVVDDDPEIRQMLVELLGEEPDLAAVGVETAEAALGFCGHVRPAAVLLDLAMPGMGGLELARRVRSSPQLADVPLVAMSAMGSTINPRRLATQAGCDAALDKPFDVDEMLATLRRCMAERTSSRADAAPGTGHTSA
jgi:CheY-like chemotaxis protein